MIERPRQFVKATDFFGPDRRRRSRGPYEGPMRRDNDLSDPVTREAMLSQQLAAHNTLLRIREKSGLKKGDKFDINPDDIDMV